MVIPGMVQTLTTDGFNLQRCYRVKICVLNRKLSFVQKGTLIFIKI